MNELGAPQVACFFIPNTAFPRTHLKKSTYFRESSPYCNLVRSRTNNRQA